jgi:hypothetical protein
MIGARLMPGTVCARDMIGTSDSENQAHTGGMRLWLFEFFSFGIGLVLRPLAVLVSVLPIVSAVLRVGVLPVAMSIAAPLDSSRNRLASLV